MTRGLFWKGRPDQFVSCLYQTIILRAQDKLIGSDIGD
jgi:hypothetical protein